MMIECLVGCRVEITWLDATEQEREFMVLEGDDTLQWVCLRGESQNAHPIWRRLSDIHMIEELQPPEEEANVAVTGASAVPAEDPRRQTQIGPTVDGTVASLHFPMPLGKSRLLLAIRAEELLNVLASLDEFLAKQIKDGHGYAGADEALIQTRAFLTRELLRCGLSLKS